jgi:hypothetical protein
MSVPARPNRRPISQLKRRADPQPERVEPANLQEQFTGPLLERSERPAAEFLLEHQAETDPDGMSAVFIP